MYDTVFISQGFKVLVFGNNEDVHENGRFFSLKIP